MWTTWASPEGGGPGKEGCGRAKGAGLALWGRGSGSHFSAVFSDGYRKGPSSALPILLLGQTDSVAFYIPHRRQTKTQVRSCSETNHSHPHAPSSYTPASEGDQKSHV